MSYSFVLIVFGTFNFTLLSDQLDFLEHVRYLIKSNLVRLSIFIYFGLNLAHFVPVSIHFFHAFSLGLEQLTLLDFLVDSIEHLLCLVLALHAIVVLMTVHDVSQGTSLFELRELLFEGTVICVVTHLIN